MYVCKVLEKPRFGAATREYQKRLPAYSAAGQERRAEAIQAPALANLLSHVSLIGQIDR